MYVANQYYSLNKEDFFVIKSAVCTAAFNFRRAQNFLRTEMVSCRCITDATRSRCYDIRKDYINLGHTQQQVCTVYTYMYVHVHVHTASELQATISS